MLLLLNLSVGVLYWVFVSLTASLHQAAWLHHQPSGWTAPLGLCRLSTTAVQWGNEKGFDQGHSSAGDPGKAPPKSRGAGRLAAEFAVGQWVATALTSICGVRGNSLDLDPDLLLRWLVNC